MTSNRSLTRQVEKFLDADEAVVAVAKCLPVGARRQRAVGAFCGVAGMLAVERATASPVFLGTPLPKNMLVAVTNRRVVVLRLSDVSGRAEDITHAVPTSDVTEVHAETGRAVGARVVNITIAITDGSTMAVEAVRPYSKAGEEVARAISAAAPLPRST